MKRLSLFSGYYRAPLLLTFTVLSAPAATLLVWQESPAPAPPYASWATAAHTIQSAVDAAAAGDTVLVTNGIYASGSRTADGVSLMSHRLVVQKPVWVRSVNGAAVTSIEGAAAANGGNGPEAVRCGLLSGNAVLSGFTLRGGHTWNSNSLGHPFYERSGGALLCAGPAVVSNCVVVANSSSFCGGASYQGAFFNTYFASNSTVLDGGAVVYGSATQCIMSNNYAGEAAGGAYGSMLQGCIIAGNSSWYAGGIFGGTCQNSIISGNSAGYGGGVEGGATLYNCLVVSNTATVNGGGAMEAYLYNCTVYGNTAGWMVGGVYGFVIENCIVQGNAPNNYDIVMANYCCTTPLPTDGTGNIDADPGFVDLPGGNFQLAADSPCIDAGTNLSFAIFNDLDGNPRPVDGNGDGVAAFDIGAYEFGKLLPSDSDGDGVPDDQDACPGTAPGEIVDAQGCSIGQLVPCEGPRAGGKWKNHGEYVAALGKAVRAFESAGLLSHAQGQKLLTAGAKSDCGKK